MTLENWRDLSIILLAVEAFVIVMVPAAVFFFTIKGVLWMNRKISIAGPIVRGYFRKAERSTKIASDRIAAPFITASATTARVKRWQHVLMSSSRTRNEV
jgi:hypothetical protein